MNQYRIDASVALRLYRARESLGLSLYRMAEKTGMTTVSINRYETVGSGSYLNRYARYISNQTGQSLDYLLAMDVYREEVDEE